MVRLWRTDPDRAAWIALLTILPVVAALILWLDRGTTYNVDQIRFFLANPGVGFGDLFEPQNSNLLAPTILSYKVFLDAFGSSFLPFRLLHVATLLATCTVFFALIKGRVGPLAGLAITLILLVFGSDWGHVGTALGFTVLSSVGAGLGALLLLERRDLVGDLGSCALLIFSLASFSTGLAFLVGAGVSLLLEPDRRRELWVAAIPFALYLAWWLWARNSDSPLSGPELSNVLLAPAYSFVSLSAVLVSLTGLNFDFSTDAIRLVPLGPGPALAALALLGLGHRLARGRVPTAVWVGLAMLAAYWTLGALVVDPASGIRVPTKTRYMFPGAVMVLLLAAALIDRPQFGKRTATILLIAAACGVATNLALLRNGTAYFRDGFSAPAKAQFTMLDLGGDEVAPDFDPKYVVGDPSVISSPAGPYLTAAALYGSPGFTLDELADQDDDVREVADQVLVAALELELERAGDSATGRRCPGGADSIGPTSTEIPGAGGTVEIRSDGAASVTLGRFADDPTVELGDLAAGVPTRLSIPGDDASTPWRVQIDAPTGARVCGPSAAG